jgi:hypothetical protein
MEATQKKKENIQIVVVDRIIERFSGISFIIFFVFELRNYDPTQIRDADHETDC